MDISPQYIEMCNAANEIQTKYNEGFSLGDVAVTLQFDDTWGKPYIVQNPEDAHIESNRDVTQHITIRLTIWLPRQDQLQDMLNSRSTIAKWNILNHFCETYFVCQSIVPSFEQIWLMIVMGELYKKVWNREVKNWLSLK